MFSVREVNDIREGALKVLQKGMSGKAEVFLKNREVVRMKWFGTMFHLCLKREKVP